MADLVSPPSRPRRVAASGGQQAYRRSNTSLGLGGLTEGIPMGGSDFSSFNGGHSGSSYLSRPVGAASVSDSSARWSYHPPAAPPPPLPAHSGSLNSSSAAESRLSALYPRQPKYSYLVSKSKPEYFGRRDDYLSYLTGPVTASSALDAPPGQQALDPMSVSAVADYGVQSDPLASRRYNVSKSKSYSNFDMMRSQVRRRFPRICHFSFWLLSRQILFIPCGRNTAAMPDSPLRSRRQRLHWLPPPLAAWKSTKCSGRRKWTTSSPNTRERRAWRPPHTLARLTSLRY